MLSGKQNKPQMKLYESNIVEEFKKTKIDLNDSLFQIKKMQEDHAEQKSKINRQFLKEKKLLEATIQQITKNRIQDNDNWAKLIDTLRAQKITLIQEQKTQIINLIAQVESKTQKKMQNFYQIKISSLAQNLAILQNQINTGQLIHVNYFNNKLQQIKLEYEIKQSTIINIYEQKINQLCSQHSVQINRLTSYGKDLEQFRKCLSDKLNQVYQNYSILKKSSELEIAELKFQVQTILKQSQIQRQLSNQQIANLKYKEEILNKELSNKIAQYEEEIRCFQEKSASLIKQQELRWKKEMDNLVKSVKKVEQNCKDKQKILQERVKMLLSKYQSREAREEDIKIIRQLQIQLIGKTFELEDTKKQINALRMELDNLFGCQNLFPLSHNALHATFKSRKLKLPHLKDI